MSVAEATIETLLHRGLDTVYALPRLHKAPSFDAFYHASDQLWAIALGLARLRRVFHLCRVLSER